MKSQKGQASVEMVVMLVLLVSIFALVSSAFRDNQFFANLVSGPWRSVAGLIQNGVWGTPEETMSKHPSQFSRISTVKGDPVEK